VVDGNGDCKAILVYDVSRWDRFQDVDEAAYYEFLCKRAGIKVHYYAEPFCNDDTMPSMVMKALKRVMASEYSGCQRDRIGRVVVSSSSSGSFFGFRHPCAVCGRGSYPPSVDGSRRDRYYREVGNESKPKYSISP
jgi:hypothetical protein